MQQIKAGQTLRTLITSGVLDSRDEVEWKIAELLPDLWGPILGLLGERQLRAEKLAKVGAFGLLRQAAAEGLLAEGDDLMIFRQAVLVGDLPSAQFFAGRARATPEQVVEHFTDLDGDEAELVFALAEEGQREALLWLFGHFGLSKDDLRRAASGALNGGHLDLADEILKRHGPVTSAKEAAALLLQACAGSNLASVERVLAGPELAAINFRELAPAVLRELAEREESEEDESETPQPYNERFIAVLRLLIEKLEPSGEDVGRSGLLGLLAYKGNYEMVDELAARYDYTFAEIFDFANCDVAGDVAHMESENDGNTLESGGLVRWMLSKRPRR